MLINRQDKGRVLCVICLVDINVPRKSKTRKGKYVEIKDTSI